MEAEDLRMRLTAEHTEKTRELESAVKALREDLRRKEAHLLELTNDVTIFTILIAFRQLKPLQRLRSVWRSLNRRETSLGVTFRLQRIFRNVVIRRLAMSYAWGEKKTRRLRARGLKRKRWRERSPT